MPEVESEKLKKRIALALQVEPTEIIGFKKYPHGYNVIMWDFRKFTGVQPVEEEKVVAIQEAELKAEEEARAQATAEEVYPPGLPEELQQAYHDPASVYLPVLKDLARWLNLGVTLGGIRKANLIEEIELYKKHYHG